jgi:hypothetical protein
MKSCIFFLLIFFCIQAPRELSAQKYLPDFSVTEIARGSNKISWLNPFKNCVQIAVQRSADSLKNFKTILSAKNPELKENGFTDNSASHSSPDYYRIFYTLSDGSYFFSAVFPVKKEQYKTDTRKESKEKIKTIPKKIIKGKRPSRMVYTDGRGNLVIAIPAIKQHQYTLIIYDTDRTILFTIKRIQEPELTIEKANFLHTGWFSFELFEDGILIEKNRFYIQ